MALSKKDVPRIVSKVKPEAFAKTVPVETSTVKAFGTSLMNDVGGGAFDVTSPAVKRFIKDYSAKRIKDINDTTRDRLTRLLDKSIDAGKSTDEIAALIEDRFDEMTRGRAFSIARTEVSRASNFGAHEGMEQAGVEKKEWLATDDGNVRDTHADLSGTVVDISDPFKSPSGATADYPGDFGVPEEDINCRCGVLPVVSDKRLRVSRVLVWKVLERQRAPYDKKMHKAFAAAFKTQKEDVLAALYAAA